MDTDVGSVSFFCVFCSATSWRKRQMSSRLSTPGTQLLRCQYLYFCSSEACTLVTWAQRGCQGLDARPRAFARVRRGVYAELQRRRSVSAYLRTYQTHALKVAVGGRRGRACSATRS